MLVLWPTCMMTWFIADFQWNAVALWAWDIVVDNCAICRNHIMDLCELVFPLIWTHIFHTVMHELCGNALYVVFVRYRMPGQPGFCHVWGVHRGLGRVQCKCSQFLTFQSRLDGSWLCIYEFKLCLDLGLYTQRILRQKVALNDFFLRNTFKFLDS